MGRGRTETAVSITTCRALQLNLGETQPLSPAAVRPHFAMNSIPPTPASSSTPPPVPGHATPAGQGDATGGIIPYKNPHALTSYYLGIFSIIPVLGFILGCVAVPLAISGLKRKKATPAIKGTAHAWVGIILGGGSVLVHLTLVIMGVVAATQSGR